MDDNFTFGKGHYAIWIRNSMEYEQGIIMILRNCHKLEQEVRMKNLLIK